MGYPIPSWLRNDFFEIVYKFEALFGFQIYYIGVNFMWVCELQIKIYKNKKLEIFKKWLIY